MNTALTAAIAAAGVLVFAALICAAITEIIFRIAVSRYGIGRKMRRSMAANTNPEYESNSFVCSYIDLYREGVKWIESMPFETVSIKSDDGLLLCGYLLTCENAARSMICVHGFRGSGKKDFAFVSEFYHESNCNLLIIDQRTHGLSEGKYICYGAKERLDCVRWAEFMRDRFGEDLPMYYNGISMGCASVLMASVLPLPKNLRGIIADCGYTSAWEEFAHVIRKRCHLPAFPFLHFANHLCRTRAGIDLQEFDVSKIIAENKIPVLFIHGEADTFVPTEMGRRNYEACGSEKSIVLVKGARHGVSYLEDTPGCQRAIAEFFKKHDGDTGAREVRESLKNF